VDAKAGRQTFGGRMKASAESGTPNLELHGTKTGNCLRAAIGLSEAGLLYETRHVADASTINGQPLMEHEYEIAFSHHHGAGACKFFSRRS